MTSRIEKLLKAYAEGKGGDIVDGEAPSRIEAILEEIIENRPFYEEEGAEVETVLMEKTLLELLEISEGENMGFAPNAFMEAGKEYTVTVNGVSRTYTAQSFTFEGVSATYIGDDIRLMMGDSGIEPTEGFLYADLKDMGRALGSPTDEMLFSENFNIELTDYESFVTIMVKVSGMEKGTYVKQISGKFVEDMYYTEIVHDDRVYVDHVELKYNDVGDGNAYSTDELPHCFGDFGSSGRRIIEFPGKTYEADIIDYSTVIEGISIKLCILGNPSLINNALIAYILYLLVERGDIAEIVDNGLPFVISSLYAPKVISLNGTIIQVSHVTEGSMAPTSVGEGFLIPNHFYTDYHTLTIRGADSEVIHKVPAKYLPDDIGGMDEKTKALVESTGVDGVGGLFEAMLNKMIVIEEEYQMKDGEFDERITALETSIGTLNTELENVLMGVE